MAAPVRAGALLLLAAAPLDVLALRRAEPSPPVEAAVPKDYFWPEAHGSPNSYGVSSFAAPRNLTSTHKWAWFSGGRKNRHHSGPHYGLVIDNESSIYLSSADGVRKFNSHGHVAWHAPLNTQRLPTLAAGKVFITDNNGTAVALSMETGQPVWSSVFAQAVGAETPGLVVSDGVMVAAGGLTGMEGAAEVTGLNASNGNRLWDFKPDAKLYNFMPLGGNGTVIFQDQNGGVYRLRARDGKRVMRSGHSGQWDADRTHGMPTVKDGLIYALHTDGRFGKPGQKTSIRAYQMATGLELWQHELPQSVSSQPAVGHLGSGAGLSERLAMVMPIGASPTGTWGVYESAIRALDAKTGELIWSWTPPPWIERYAAGDSQRKLEGTPCMPGPYANPSIDAWGTTYVGHFNGLVYAIRDDNGDGTIQDSEVSSYNTGAGFGMGGAAIAPGMLAIASCDGLHVFKE